MDLNEWMTKTERTSKEVGDAIGKSSSYVRELRRGARMPSLTTAHDIAALSDGLVGTHEWPSNPTPESEPPVPPAQPAAEQAAFQE